MPSISLLIRSLLTEPLVFLLSIFTYFWPAPIPKLLLIILNFVGIDILQSHNYLPHHSAPFEGYYTRISADNDATILIIFSTVRTAQPDAKPNLLHFSYLPKERKGAAAKGETIIVNVFPGSIEYRGQTKNVESSLLEITATTEKGYVGRHLGKFVVVQQGDGREYLSYKLFLPESQNGGSAEETIRSWISVSIEIGERVPWNGGVGWRHNTLANGSEGPLSALIHLLPLHWFVWTVGSEADIMIKRVRQPSSSETDTVATDNLDDYEQVIWSGKGKAHVEKNWGWSFPKGWVWYVIALTRLDLRLTSST